MNSVIDIPISELIKNSAESTLQNINCTCDGVIIHCYVPDLLDKFGINITDSVVRIYARAEYIFLHSSCIFNDILSCFFQVVELNEVVSTNEWGFYIPPCDKKLFFEQTKRNLTLAYGKHSSKYKWLFKIEPEIFQALICNLDDIKCQIIDSAFLKSDFLRHIK
jgi:hypothetical protein